MLIHVVAVLLMAGATAAFAQTAAARPSQRIEALARDILTELIGIDTTRGTTAAARAVARRALAAGFPPDDVRVLIPGGHPEKGNTVVRLHGRHTSSRPVLYLTHLDVVDARREDWTYEPFRLTEQSGWLYGRGTIDMKGPAAAVLASLIRMRQEGITPGRDIIAAFTCDEESRGQHGVKWLLAEHRDLADGAIVINPDGGEAGMKAGKRIHVGVQTSEKAYASFQLETTDKGGHSSRPGDNNAIYRLAQGLTRLAALRFPVHLTDTTKAYFERRAAIETGQVQSDMRTIVQSPPAPEAAERLSSVVETNILLRTTCTTTIIEGGHAENALPQRARATVQCRMIPGESQQSVQDAIRAAVADPAVVVSVLTPAVRTLESPLTPDIIGSVESVVRSMWPGVVVLPQMSAGATDSVYTRELGIPSYGIDGIFDDLDDVRAHGRDERIGIAAFADEIEFTYRLMREISSAR